MFEDEITRIEAAKILGVSKRTMDAWALKGIGPRYRRRGRFAYYRLSDLKTWSDENQLVEPRNG